MVPIDSGVGDQGFNCRSQSSTTVNLVDKVNKNVALVGVLGFLLVESPGSPSRSRPWSALAGFTSVSQH